VAARPAPAHAGDRSWTLELHTPRPLHPERLLERIEELGAGRLRARGVFWVPNRPDSACLWDGAGGQLAVGDLGPWHAVADGGAAWLARPDVLAPWLGARGELDEAV
jgi:G3E family GTPase